VRTRISLLKVVVGMFATLLLVSCMDVAGSSGSSSGTKTGNSTPNAITLIGYEDSSETAERTLELQGATTSGKGDSGVVVVHNSMGTTQANLTVVDGAYQQTIETAHGNNQIEVTIYEGNTKVESAKTTVISTAEVAPVRVRLTWDTPDNDVDLYVTSPSGQVSYYSNPSIDAGFLDIDDVTGYGPETFAVTAGLSGKYKIGVNYFSADGITSNVNVSVKVSFNEGAWQNGGTTVYTPSDADGGTTIRPLSEFTL